MSRQVKVTLPKEVLTLPLAQREDIIKSLADQLQVHTSHDPDRDMWTPDEVPMIAGLEDWFYGELFRSTWDLYTTLIDALGLPVPEAVVTAVEKSFGDEFLDYLQKSNSNFKLGDMIRMNRRNRQKLLQYVADGGVYSKDELNHLQSLIDASMPNYGPLLEAYAVRAVLLGRIKRVADQNTLQMMGTMIERLPARIEQLSLELPPVVLTDSEGKKMAVQLHPLSDAEKHAILYADQHAAQYVTNATTRLKTGIQQIVTDSRRNRETPQVVQQRLLDRFGEQNRDWRRIALTEITDAMANGYLASLKSGQRVTVQGSAHACEDCKRMLIGKIFIVSDRPDDPLTHVWPGKTNIGRKKADWIPTIPLHPHDRCRFTAVSDFQDIDKQSGALYIKPLDELIEEYKKKGLIHPDYDPNVGNPS